MWLLHSILCVVLDHSFVYSKRTLPDQTANQSKMLISSPQIQIYDTNHDLLPRTGEMSSYAIACFNHAVGLHLGDISD
jgi:hypothetical protein